jgi:hypothetical protein
LDIEHWNNWLKVGISLGAVFAGIITFFLTKWRKKVKKKKNILSPLDEVPSGYWDVHTKIQDTLTELRIMVDCARAQLVQFHNSGHFLDGISMKKSSLTHESVQRSIVTEGNKKQDLILSMFLPVLSAVKEDDAIIRLVSDLDESYAKHFLESSNVVAFSILPIKTSGMVSGYVMIQWCSWEKIDGADAELVSEWMHRSRSLLEVEIQSQKVDK